MLAQFANIFDAPVRGGVDFDDIGSLIIKYAEAGKTLVARLKAFRFGFFTRLGTRLGVQASSGAGKDARAAGFSGSARSADKIRVRNPFMFQGLLKG